jgi:hypothetical protein
MCTCINVDYARNGTLFIEISLESFHRIPIDENAINFNLMSKGYMLFGDVQIKGVIITASTDNSIEKNDNQYHFISRYFAPW